MKNSEKLSLFRTGESMGIGLKDISYKHSPQVLNSITIDSGISYNIPESQNNNGALSRKWEVVVSKTGLSSYTQWGGLFNNRIIDSGYDFQPDIEPGWKFGRGNRPPLNII